MSLTLNIICPLNYLRSISVYAEFESKLLGFVDDVEFFFQPDNTSVEYRSASRLGESDLDANRKRIRDLRVALQEMVSNLECITVLV